MSTVTQPSPSFRFSRNQTLGLVALCTVFGAAAQVLIKSGANHLHGTDAWSMITNPLLMLGYSLYGVSTVLLVLALRQSELSLLYPIISLTYVWVTILSVTVFHEQLTAYKAVGITIIVIGVGILGWGSKK
jgi:drug/metabolite transporter (DMT)-like permease